MLLYNFFIFGLLKSRLYLYYVLYLFLGLVGMINLSGFGPTYLYPNSVWRADEGDPEPDRPFAGADDLVCP